MQERTKWAAAGRSAWLAVSVAMALLLAGGCDSGESSDPGGDGALPLEDASGDSGEGGADTGGEGGADTGGEGGADTGGEGGADTGGEGGADTGGEGGADTGGEGGDEPTTDDALAALSRCATCHGGPACTTGVCFLDDPSILQDAPPSFSSWCTDDDATIAECAVHLMADQKMPIGCAGAGTCSTAEDIDTLQAWIDAGYPE